MTRNTMDEIEKQASQTPAAVDEAAGTEKPVFLEGDVAAGLFEQAMQYGPERLANDAIKVRWKLDLVALPMMMFTNMLAFLDKQTLNYSNAYGLQAANHMTGNEYAWVASAMYFGWLVGAWPASLLVQRYPISKVVGLAALVWGLICMLQAAPHSFSGFFAVRFFLGFVESVLNPSWLLLTSILWTRDEQPLRTEFWIAMNGMAAMLGALLSWGFGTVEGSAIPNWKLIFLLVGAVTFLWAFAILFYLPDGPHQARILTEHERVVAVWRISKNRTGVQHGVFKWDQLREAVLDPKSYLLLAMAATYGMLNAGMTNFMSSLIKGFGFSSTMSTLLQMPGGAVQVVGCVMFGYIATAGRNMNGVGTILGCFPGIGGLVGLLVISRIPEHKYNLVGCAWALNCLGAPTVLNWGLPGMNIAGHTKRSTMMGMYFIFNCAGNIAGPHFFRAQDAPLYFPAIRAVLSLYAIAVFLQVVYMTICFLQNRHRDKKGYHAQDEDEAREGFEDLTDLQNRHFRYKL